MKALVLVLAMFGAGVAAAAPCKEGSKGSVTLFNQETGKSYTEVRTCVNGTYMTAEEKAAYVYNPSTRCKEGSKGSVTLFDQTLGKSYTEYRICRNGSYMTDAERAAYVRVPKNRCKEGAIYQDTQRDNINDRNVYVVYQCQSGKWIEIRRWN